MQEDDRMSIRTSYKQGTPSWVDLATTDQDGAKTFYSSLLGWDWNDMDMGDGAFYSMAQLKGKSAAGAYTQMQDERDMGIPPHWTTYITVDDVDATAAKVESAGGKVHVPPFDVFDSGRMTMIEDPTGGVVGLWQAKNHIGSEIVNEPTAFCWAELMTDDVEKAGAFFEEVLVVAASRASLKIKVSIGLLDKHYGFAKHAGDRRVRDDQGRW